MNEEQLKFVTTHSKLIKEVPDVSRFDERLLPVRWAHFPLYEVEYNDLRVKLQTNPHLKGMRILIDCNGELILRINPNATWKEISTMMVAASTWYRAQREQIYKNYDTVAWQAQKECTYSEGDVVYLWGQPYVIHIERGSNAHTSKEKVQVIAPRPVMLGLVPPETSRFTDRLHALVAYEYLNREAVYSLPFCVSGRVVLPQHCHWVDYSDMAYEDKYDRQQNYYEYVFRLALNRCVWAWQNKTYLAHLMLFNPRLALLEQVFADYYFGSIERNKAHLEADHMTYGLGMARNALENMKYAIGNGSIVDHRYKSFYASDPLANAHPERMEEIWSRLSYSFQETRLSPAGIRADVAPARIPSPPQINFMQLNRDLLAKEIIWQRGLFALAGSQAARYAQTFNLYEDISGLECAMFNLYGEEIDPAGVMVAYLPDDPYIATLAPDKLSVKEVVRMGSGNFISYNAYKYYADNMPPVSDLAYFHQTLVEPGIITLNFKGAKDISQDTVHEVLARYFSNQLQAAASNYARLVEPDYKNMFALFDRVIKMPPYRWFDRMEVRKMKPFGQYRLEPTNFSVIRLNRSLAAYPINVMAAIVNHEITHISYPNHGSRFHFVLDLICPGSDIISNSVAKMSIFPL